MLVQRGARPRTGATIVESAIVYPVVFLLLLGLIVGGMGIFRYQEVSALARAGARYASTHGVNYRKDTGLGTGSAGTSAGDSGGMHWFQADPTLADASDTSWTQDTYDKGIRPNLVAMDPARLSVKVGWPPVINQADKPDNWPGSKVSVTYSWLPEVLFVGPITLTSTSTMAITN